MDFEAHQVDTLPVDEDLVDAGTVGPELAHLSRVYLRSPRALSWRHPSPEWAGFVLLLPLGSRLSLMANPIFAQLTRTWGLNVRFIGIDRAGLVHDFRNLLSDGTLRLIVRLLDAELADDRPLLDTLFAALAQEMLTVVGERRPGWGRHLATEHRLESLQPGTLFARESRYPDFLSALRAALRDEIIDAALYGRALRAIDLRELAAEERIAAEIETALDAATLERLRGTGAGRHLGAYNWLRIGERHAASRAHVLSHLPGLATFFAEALLPLDAAMAEAGFDEDMAASEADRAVAAPAPGVDLRSQAAGAAGAHSVRWTRVMRRAIDAGQDRAVIEAIAQRFAIGDNVVRRLWRERPAALGQPPGWRLARVLRQLDALGERQWPTGDTEWQALLARAVPDEAR